MKFHQNDLEDKVHVQDEGIDKSRTQQPHKSQAATTFSKELVLVFSLKSHYLFSHYLLFYIPLSISLCTLDFRFHVLVLFLSCE